MIAYVEERLIPQANGAGPTSLAAQWSENLKPFRPKLVTSTESAHLRKRHRKTRGNGSIDPKTGRVRKIIDPYKGEVQAAPIPDRFDWSKVPPFELPDLDQIEGWSKAADEMANEELASLQLYRPESKSMTVRVEGLSLGYNKSLKTTAALETEARRLHQKYPETEFDKKLDLTHLYRSELEDCQGGSLLTELTRASSSDPKMSLLRSLYETGAFDDFPLKIKATALLMSRGITTKESASEVFLDQVLGLRQISHPKDSQLFLEDELYEKFKWIYTEEDFQRYRSVVQNILSGVLANTLINTSESIAFDEMWERFEIVWSKLSRKQRDAAELLYMGEEPYTFKAAAEILDISVDSLRDRWELMKRRFRKAFPEFDAFKPAKTYTKNKKGSHIYWGLYWHESAEKIHEVTTYSDSGVNVTKSTPKPYSGPTREMTPEIRTWLDSFRTKYAGISRLNDFVIPGKTSAISTYRKEFRENEKTPDLWDVFNPQSRKKRDLSILSPLYDDIMADTVSNAEPFEAGSEILTEPDDTLSE